MEEVKANEWCSLEARGNLDQTREHNVGNGAMIQLVSGTYNHITRQKFQEILV